MKYWFLGLFVLVSACTPTVEVDDVRQYKCGTEIIKAMFLEDNSIILDINSANYVLSRSATNSGRRYDSADSNISFIQEGNNSYLAMNGKNFPLCLELEY